ncbi:ATP-binding protein [Xanthomarina sp. F1114]|uniref:ATP-binding protein n=1 Tax=Xanthomarina sp. F1114 TaxID=2996019 RepID=UPI00225E1231|nr:ATP-binding protein [Xanthomarina sp. F1114]MCX7547225.1 ATP-binding protein [Xanthomarina sp. F1114]
MDFKQLYTSSKTYIFLLFVALGLFLFSTLTTYKQIIRMQKSAETVKHTLQVYNGISNLTTHFTEAESEEFRKNILKTEGSSRAFEIYKLEGQTIVDSLKLLINDNPDQLNRLETLNTLLDRLYQQLKEVEGQESQGSMESFSFPQNQTMKINGTLHHLREIKNEMLVEEESLMQERKADYDSYKSLAPKTLLFLAFFALSVFVISFIRIYKNKRRFRESEAFLKSVLSTTDNVVNYYEPIIDDTDKIVDFLIVFANDCNRDYFGLEPDEIIGKTISEVFPFIMDNGEFEEMKFCYNKKSKTISERQVVIKGEKMWFESIVTPLADGILETARNTSAQEKAKTLQLSLKKRLEKQNLTLLDNRAFLANIFKSISHVVMNFKSIRDTEGKIVDFEILFVNNRINPLTGDVPEDLKNKKVSQVYPHIFESGVFEYLVNAIENNESETYEISHQINDKLYWFRSTAIKLGDGVTVTSREITEEKERADQLINLNEQLVIRNSILTGAEGIAKIGSYLWYMDSDISEISDNFFRMLGYQVNEFDPSLKKYTEFIHPEDIEFVKNITEQVLQDMKPREYTYRVITKSGSIKHFKTNGQFINKNNKTVMIGVVQDVTETVETEESLRKSNLDLKQSNAELESFNRVASHDLQEPLRKIQLFVSRIEDKENERFSEKSRAYFEKVKLAGSRMQSLIQNLLAYSQIDSSRTDFESVNLNLVLEKVLEDLATRIADANAIIKVDDLPEIKGVLFQLEQLFSNLISNALKYKSKTETPTIEIKLEKIHASNISIDFVKSHLYYYKITVADNGIGFDDRHSNKIFEVFQRLHQKNEYSGTGIGLAICKKIVENHNGFIHASAKLGKGSQFFIYLPA